MTRCATISLLVLLTASSSIAQTPDTAPPPTSTPPTTPPTTTTTTTTTNAEAAPTATSPATPPAPAPAAVAAPSSEIDWLRAGVSIGSFVLQANGFTLAPGLSAVVEACPSEVFCLFGSARGTASTYPNASAAGPIGGTSAPFSSSSLVAMSLNAGGRYVLSPGAQVEISPWLSFGLGAGFAEGTTFTSYDPVTGAPLPTQTGLFGTQASLTAGVLAEREMWDRVRVRVSTSLLRGSAAWTSYSGYGNGSSDLSFAADLILQPSFAVLLEL